MKRVSASLVLVMLTSCLPLPGGTTVSRQQVAGKSGEDLLVARSGDTCQVSSVVHERISIGDTHVCAWKSAQVVPVDPKRGGLPGGVNPPPPGSPAVVVKSKPEMTSRLADNTHMTSTIDSATLDAVMDAWHRGNTALIGLLQLLPAEAFGARAMPESPTIAQMCAHLHQERLVSVAENAPEHAESVPSMEWDDVREYHMLARWLTESCARVECAVRARIRDGRTLDRDFAHPIQLVQFLIFHDGYHHGQIKLALKAAGISVPDDAVGEHVWDVLRARDARRADR